MVAPNHQNNGTSSASTTTTPILGLKLKSSALVRRTSAATSRSHSSSSPIPIPIPAVVDKELVVDQVRLLYLQDLDSYKCDDYLARRSAEAAERRRGKAQGPHHPAADFNHEEKCDDPDAMEVDYTSYNTTKDTFTSSSMEEEEEEEESTEEEVDAVCREKMCEWSYRVCDHFNVPRDMVAISFSYLDRFTDRCQCDRTTFKLAAMTTLYMANKICGIAMPTPTTSSSSSASSSHHRGQQHPHCNNPLTIKTLANLSRGEFEMNHIAEMESLLLSTLSWKVNPPTTQSFVDSFLMVIPTTHQEGSSLHHDMIYQRSIFFAELAVYDYTLVTKGKALIALSSILNAMEGMNLPTMQDYVCNQVVSTFGIGYPEDVMETCRNRLWYIYGNSAQYEDEERRLCMMNDNPASSSRNDGGGAHGTNNKQQLLTKNKKKAASSSSSNGIDDDDQQPRKRMLSGPRSPVSVAN